MIRKFKAIAVTLVVAAGLLLAVATPAQAAFSACPNDRMCIFDNANGGGFQYNFGPSVYPGCVNNGRWNVTSSAANRKFGTKVKFFSAPNCFLLSGFTSTYIYSGGNINFGFGLDNQVASFSWVPA